MVLFYFRLIKKRLYFNERKLNLPPQTQQHEKTSPLTRIAFFRTGTR